jgi:hypothetical protein
VAAFAGGIFLAACTELTGSEEDAGETIAQGMGQVHIRLNQLNARTVLPGLEGIYFTLEFTASGKTSENKSLYSDSGLSLTVALESAIWTLVVKGYKGHTDDDIGRLMVQGTSSVPVTAGMFSNVAVALVPVFDSGVTGTLSYSIKFSETVRQAFLSLQGTGHKIDMLESTEETEETTAKGIAEGTIEELPAGAYQVFIDLYDHTTNQAAVWTGMVHIYDDSITELDQTFTAVNFAGPQVVGKDEATLAGKLAAAIEFPRGACTIVLDGAEELIAFAPQTLSVTDGTAIAIIIEGNGKTVQVTETGTPLFTLDTGLTLILQDITLQGKSGNNAPVVQVKDGGTLDLQDGSSLTGNSSSSNGGGVVVESGGTLSMSGGEISGNTVSGTSGSGGGVYINGGTLSMSGGAISGNKTSGSNGGGQQGGGGVFITNGGTFTMTGGAVSGNSSNYDSGGVFIFNGTFEMSGGAVSGNTARYAGGVYASSSGTFTMSDGVVSGNSASIGYGGGLYVNGGTFTMTGGVIYGSEEEAGKKNTAPSGAAFYRKNGTIKPASLSTTNTTIDMRPVNPYPGQARFKRSFRGGLPEWSPRAWEIEREGEKGPFGAIEEAIIP